MITSSPRARETYAFLAGPRDTPPRPMPMIEL